MDAESLIAIKMLEVLGKSTAAQIEFCARLHQTWPAIKHTERATEARTYQGGSTDINSYVEAYFHNGNYLLWAYNITWDEGEWVVDGSISFRDGPYERTVKELYNRKTEEFPELLRYVDEVISLIIESIDIVNDYL